MSEWSEARLANVAEIRFSNVDKKTIPGEVPVRLCNYMDVYGNGGYIANDLPFMEASASMVEIERFRVECGDVLLTKDSETPDDIGIPAVVVDEIQNLVCGYHLALIKPNPERIDSMYLAKQLGGESTARCFSRLANGSTRYGLSSSSIADTVVPLAPLPEQRRIAEILSTVDEAIEQTEKLIAKYQQIKAGLMQDLFTRGLFPEASAKGDVTWTLRPTRAQAPHLYKESALGWIPKEWGVVSVRDCGSVQLGRQRSPDQMSGRWTMPYLRVANVFDGYIDYSDVLEMDFTHEERRTFSLKQGDILLNEGQSLELVGRSALYDGKDDAFCFQNTLVRFRPLDKQSSFFYRFLFKWFLDCGLFMRIAKQTTSVAHLGADRFARMQCISVPCDEQLRIAGLLGVLQARLDNETAHITKLRQQRQGLMHDLLTGRVRVKVAQPVGGMV